MKRIEHLASIAGDIGAIFRWLSLLALAPFIVIAIFGEWQMTIPMAPVPILFFILGYMLQRVRPNERHPKFSVALVGVALTWLFAALIGAIPFLLGAHMSVTDSLFESMSGWTTSGFSVVPVIDDLPQTLVFWRSYTQWIGGIGIIAFGVAMYNRSAITLSRLYHSEGRPEEFMPSVIGTARRVWVVYLALTVAFTVLILFSGIPLWDSLNLVMVAISTGGFSNHDGGVLYYQNPILEGLLIPVMIAGSLPIQVSILLYYGKCQSFLKSRILHFIAAATLIVSALVIFNLYWNNRMPLSQAVREGVFCVVSGFTTTGFQNSDILAWAPVAVVLLAILMFIGTSLGSTGGGIKVNRVLLTYSALVWWFKRLFVGRSVRIPFRYEGTVYPESVSDVEIAKNMLIIFLYFFTFVSATVFALQITATSFTVYEVVFEVVSALSNVGLSVGYLTPDSPLSIKWLFIFMMWIGRLEFVAVIVLFIGLVKGFDAFEVR
jgi:trk system potassium uptake protein TrkH